MAEPKDLAYKDYQNGMKYKDIAEKYGVTLNTVKSWKTRYNWSRDGVHTNEKGVHTKKKDAEKKPQRKRSGNPNPPNQFTKRNKAAEVHGLFSKFLPAETLEIMESMNERTTADLIWDQIQIQYAAIIRAQQIMFVRDKDDTTIETKKEKSSMSGDETEYEIQFAWDKHATFLNAQSRAMSELRSLIRQFDEMALMDDERRLKLEGMRVSIEKTKAEIERITNGDNDGDDQLIDDWVEAVTEDE